jgi:hypothetical protein
LTNTPTGTTPADLEPVFNEFGPLNEDCPIKKIKEQEAFFVNFMTNAGTEKALQTSQCKALRFEGSILSTKAEQNTNYIINLKNKMLAEHKDCISMDDARRVAYCMETKDKPPLTINIGTLLKAAPEHFVLDHEEVRLIHPNAKLYGKISPAVAPISPVAAPPSMPRPCSPKATSEEQANYNNMNHLSGMMSEHGMESVNRAKGRAGISGPAPAISKLGSVAPM